MKIDPKALQQLKNLKDTDSIQVFLKDNLPYKISVKDFKDSISSNNFKKYGFFIYPEELRVHFLEGDENEFNANYSWKYEFETLDTVAFKLIKRTGELKFGSFLRMTGNINDDLALPVFTHISTKLVNESGIIPNSLEISSRVAREENPAEYNTFRLDSNEIYYLEFFDYSGEIITGKYPNGVWITNGVAEE